MTNFLIGRQQIFNRKLEIYAYEILFRGHEFDLAQESQATQATNQIVTDTILELGINQLVESHKAFINFTGQNILEKTPLSLPKERIVIELLEDIKVDLRIINNIKELKQLGYTVALDDFVLTDEWRPLLEYADIIKLDVLQMSEQETLGIIKQLKHYPIKLLAEKVESHQQYEQLLELGCDYFQGFFLSKPNIVEGRRLGINQTAAIRLLAAINNPNVEFLELTQIISQDVTLSFKLLHYINSAFFAIPRRIESIRHAVSYLGLNEIKRWCNILTFASLSNKPKAILQTTLIRAKMCELLARHLCEEPEHYFLIGILSSLDSILDLPIDEALGQLPLTADVAIAILEKKGLGGEILQFVLGFEQWLPQSIHFKTLTPAMINDAYLESINWANQIMNNIE
ncbi:MAG: HDOD domain-containing protein [Gammaproteobacteria bacterium]|uniref:EAL and HDOD domain-containing protein n=1 Tax=Methylotuvimicrobium sp. TaxID=2822413 RepID=UPI001E10B7A9|nr:HDOD domain-containing protein [Gammaproteobacteria bacterium]